MGWNPFKKWFGTSGKAKQAMAQAQAESERARRLAEAAAVPTEDSNQARSAMDRRLRRISSMRSLAGTNVSQRSGTSLGG